MFERYSEGARRVIFLARQEASRFGSAYIEPEHVLLGLVQEDRMLMQRFLPGVNYATVRREVAELLPQGTSVPVSVDLPLTKEARWILEHAAEEAARLGDPQIGAEHLLLGLLREPETYAAQLAHKHGAKLAEVRAELARGNGRPWAAAESHPGPAIKHTAATRATVEIHGAAWSADYVGAAVERCREYSWHWHKRPWQRRDIAVDRQNGSLSFDLTLARDGNHFELVKGGWKLDHCAICRWELCESEEEAHGKGYTNGRDWLCAECYEKFMSRPGAVPPMAID